MRVLILGGTKDAREIAAELARDPRFDVTLSLAGRTRTPADQRCRCVSAGSAVLRGLRPTFKIRACVPSSTRRIRSRPGFPPTQSAAQRITGVPLASVVRAEWGEISGDDWHGVGDAAEAALALGTVRGACFSLWDGSSLRPSRRRRSTITSRA